MKRKNAHSATNIGDVGPAFNPERIGETMHPNRKDAITHEQARKSLQRFVNLHFKNVGEKSRASIPAHHDDDDILLSDYISQQELGPGLGSGALREALRKIVDEYDKYLAGPERLPTVGLIEAIAYGGELLSLSSPIEPPRDSRLLDTLTELLSDTELVIHAPSQEWNSRWTDATHELYERRENPKWATPQASSEVREGH